MSVHRLFMLGLAGGTLLALMACETDGTVSSRDERSSLGVVARQSIYDYAIGVLEQAASSSHPQLRANGIEGLQNAPELIEPYVRNALGDGNRGVRFAAAMTIGSLRLREIAHLAEPLLHDDSESVQAAAIYALRRCGHKADPTPLAGMLRSPDPEVRGNATMILGELGDVTALALLEQSVGIGGMELASTAQARIVDLQVAEAMVKLGAQHHVQSIRAALFYQPDTTEAELTALACVMLGRLKDSGSAGPLRRLIEAAGPERRPAEVRMAAAAALGDLGLEGAVQVASEYMGNSQYVLRYQAAMTLGASRSPAALPLLRRLLEDSNPLVRVAAASAVVRIERG